MGRRTAQSQDGGVEGVDQSEESKKTLISTEEISWGGGVFSLRTGELRELISQRECNTPLISTEGISWGG